MSLLFRFQTIAAAGSVRKASEILNVTQPALSRSIAQLEAHYGEQIFERHARGMRTTAFGERLLSTISRLSRDWELAEEHLQDGKSDLEATGRLTLSAGPLWGSVVLPTVITQLQQIFPNVTVRVIPDVADAEQAVLEGRLDASFGGIYGPEDTRSLLERRPFSDIRDRLVARADHPIHQRGADDYQAVHEYPWIAYTADPIYQAETMHAVTERTGMLPVIRVQSGSLLTTLRLLQEGDYLAILPDAAAIGFPGKPIRPTPMVLGNRGAKTGAIYRKVTAQYAPLKALLELCETYFSDRQG